MPIRVLVLCLLGLVSASCSPEQFTQMTEQSNRAAAAVEKALGTKAQIGLSTFNGHLQSVNVNLECAPLRDRTMADIEQRVRGAVTTSFGEQPPVIVLALTSRGEQNP